MMSYVRIPVASRDVKRNDRRATWLTRLLSVSRLQLRVSAGLAPASPLCPPFRGFGHLYCLFQYLICSILH